MDFLSGVFTLTSKTQHGQHHFKQTINEKFNIQYRMIAVTKFSIDMNSINLYQINVELLINYRVHYDDASLTPPFIDIKYCKYKE